MFELMEEITRILNESNVYHGKFHTVGGKIYSDFWRHTTAKNVPIDPAVYLAEIRGSYISGITTAEA